MTGDGVQLPERLALTIPEAAAAIGVSERHLRSMLPEIPHVRLGGRVVVPIYQLRKYLAEQVQTERGKVNQTVEDILASVKG